MSHPHAGGKDFGQQAKLALLGLGTLATGAVGILGLAVGYRVKKKTAPNPDEVTPATYFDDLTHLIPPWQHKDGEGTSTTSDTYANDDRADTVGFASHRDRENESKQPSSNKWRKRQTSDDELAEEARHRAELDSWEALNIAEERALTCKFEPDLFNDVAATIPLPVSTKSLFQICSYLPFESLIVLSGVCKSLRTFSNRLVRHPGIQLRTARSKEGFNEVLRGSIWMRISGAQHRANRMKVKASADAKVDFYGHLLALSIGYRETIVKQNHSGGLRSPNYPSSSSSSGGGVNSPSPDYEISGLTPEERASLDTILKDVPRTMVPSNPQSHSLISNMDGQVEGDTEANAAESSQVEGTASPAAAASAPHTPSSSSAISKPNQAVLDRNLQSTLASLSHLLSVYALHDRELGYCQGMNFVASFFLSKLPEQDAYWLFYSVMNDERWRLREFYLNDLKGLLLCKYQFSFLFELYLPELYEHFRSQDIHSDIFTEWFMTFFTYASFPRRYPLLDRVWDCMIITGGTKMLHRVALSILYLSQQTLLLYEFEDIIYYLKTLPDDGILNPDILLPIALDHFKISNLALAELEKRYELDIRESEQSRKRKEQLRENKQRAAATASQAASSVSQVVPENSVSSPALPVSPSPSPSPPSPVTRAEGQQ